MWSRSMDAEWGADLVPSLQLPQPVRDHPIGAGCLVNLIPMSRLYQDVCGLAQWVRSGTLISSGCSTSLSGYVTSFDKYIRAR